MPVLQSPPGADDRAPARSGSRRPHPYETGRPPRTDAFLVGREVERQLVVGAVDGADKRGQALLITGEPGIGKSSLLRAASQRARERGCCLLEATGVESEEGLAFAGLQLLLRPVIAAVRTLPPAQRKALATAFGLEEGPAPQPFLVGLAALNLLSEVAGTRPVVLVVDDVQWLDRPTAEALAFLARRLAGDPVVMVAGLRTGHDSSLLHAGLEAVELQGLDDVASRDLLGAVADHLDEVDREQVLRLASGNPLALVELPASWRSDRTAATRPGSSLGDAVPAPAPLSARLERAFAARLPELAPATRDALLVAAVDAEDELAEVLGAASVFTGAPVHAAVLEPAVRARLLTFDHARVRFRHPLVRSAILQSESASRRRAACAALAEVLGDQPWRRTWYRAQATTGPDEAVADELETAHAENLRRGSVTAAISALERSAQLTGSSARRGHRLLLAAELGFGLGEADLVTRLLGEAEAHALGELDRARLEWLRELPDDTDLRSARRITELVDLARRAATVDVDLALDLLVAAALRCHWGWPTSGVRDRVVTAVAGLAGTETDPRHVAALAVAQPLLQGRRVGNLLSRAGSSGQTDPEALALHGMAAFAVGDQPLAADLLRRAGAACRREGRLGLLTQVLALGSAVGMDLGDWRGAAAAADEAHRLAAETRQPTWRAGSTMTVARGHALRGEIAVARRLAAGLENDAGARGNVCAGASALLARGFALLDERRHAEAYAVLRRLFDHEDPCCHERERMPGIMFLAEAGVRAGRREDARSVVAELEDAARATPSPLLQVHLVYARAVLADDARAEPAYRSALEHDLARWPLVRARLELAYGSWLRRRRRPSDARVPLRSALETLEWIGASTWLDQARAELRATGDRTSSRDGVRREPAWQDRLTAQELQIARLAGEGLSNREIGERLFMSHRTVGAHLRHVFPKLGITSRVQLAALVAPRR
ncbi:ATP-binding protein [Microlunatus flavus]|uniref:Regulatory protein, luxR family n=1 Tax=Microlunatus flavus TaxID=1036181 RepID=A0A1H9KSY9_9ACTN|nr:LuxR family transcriptional regulator [Microlunatus flavus]SER02270.1 regulatory protein, luxR family [Microlunatus flavus]